MTAAVLTIGLTLGWGPGVGVAVAGRDPRHGTHGATTVNGEVPPGVVTIADVTLLLQQRLGGGRALYQYRSERPVGTRAPIHTHPFGGSSCVIEGENTLRIEGVPRARTVPAGNCYFMPSGPAMVNYSSGTVPLVAIDTFILAKGQRPWVVTEPGREDLQRQFRR